jgi:hypothetical protein
MEGRLGLGSVFISAARDGLGDGTGRKVCCAWHTTKYLFAVYRTKTHGKGTSLGCVNLKMHAKDFYKKIQILHRKTLKLSNGLKNTKILHRATYVVFCL